MDVDPLLSTARMVTVLVGSLPVDVDMVFKSDSVMTDRYSEIKETRHSCCGPYSQLKKCLCTTNNNLISTAEQSDGKLL